MSVNFDKMSVVQWYESTEKHRCGYCKNVTGNISQGMWAETLTVEDYQDLIDRGWRRSGKYCYKPIMNETCCPQYTIKCDASNIQLSKSQKKIIKKFNRYIEDNILNKKDSVTDMPDERGEVSEESFVKDRSNINLENISDKMSVMETTYIQQDDSFASGEPHKHNTSLTLEEKSPGVSKKTIDIKSSFKIGIGRDPNKPPCKKAKLLRLERKKIKMLSKGCTTETISSRGCNNKKNIEELVEDISQNPKVKLKLRLVPTTKPNSEWAKTKQIEFELYSKYQTIIHNDPPQKLTMDSFCNFLVKSPLKPVDFPNNIEGPGFGSFHQQYWLDDKLVAVGVIDILPKCISSVYFFYDPDYRSLTLGTYGSLREVYFTRSLTSIMPDIRWYYMGFYIHTCPKMRYKGKLSPSYLLCPETYKWIDIDQCLPLLDKNKYSRLNPDVDAIDDNVPNKNDINNMKIVYKSTIMPFSYYRRYCENPGLYSEIIGRLIGAKCTRSLVFWA